MKYQKFFMGSGICIRSAWDVDDPFQNIPGVISEPLKILPGCHTTENENCIDVGIDAGDDICVHPVTDDDGVFPIGF